MKSAAVLPGKGPSSAGLDDPLNGRGVWLRIGCVFLLGIGLLWASGGYAGTPLAKQMKVLVRSPVFQATTQTYDSAVTLTNRSRTAIQGSLQLLVTRISKPEVALANRSGTDSKNRPYLDIPLSGDGLAAGQSLNTLRLKFTNPKRARFTFGLRVVNNLATHNHPSSQPQADAGPDQTVPVGATATLDGGASSNADGRSITYRWTMVDQPAGSQTALSGANTLHPRLPIDQPGHYSVQLVVNNGSVDSPPDTVIISTDNSRPVANAGKPLFGKLRHSVTLNGTASHDIDGDPLSFHWTLSGRPKNSHTELSDADTDHPSLRLDRKGQYTARLVVNDGQGDSDPASVTISSKNSQPVADAGPDLTGQALNQPIGLNGARSSDADGDLISFRWALIHKPNGSQAVLVDPLALSGQFTPDVAGDYVAQLIVSDGRVDSKPDTAEITVAAASPTPASNRPPKITSTPATAATVGKPYNYQVLAEDPDHDTLTYSLLVSGAGMLINDPVPGLIAWTPTSAGTQPVTVKVDDGKSGSDTQSFGIVVANAIAQVQVPKLVGVGKNQALAALQAAQLKVGAVTEANDPGVPAGKVISQNPAANSSLLPGGVVDLVVSLGPIGGGLPPDPIDVAPPIDQTVATNTYTTTQFLFSGPNPIQTGVAPGAIEPKRVALLRGKVLDRSNQPLSGVKVSVHGHPDLARRCPAPMARLIWSSTAVERSPFPTKKKAFCPRIARRTRIGRAMPSWMM